MILTGIIVVILLLTFWEGWRRGLFMELLELLSTVIAFVVASLFYQEYSVKLVNYFKLSLPSDKLQVFSRLLSSKASDPFFAAFTWLLIFIAVNVTLHMFMLIFRRFRHLLSFWKIGRLIAGILAVLVTYFSLQVFLTLLALLPQNNVQSFVASSDLARWMVLHTPISSHALLKLFVENIVNVKAL
ncbi:MAG: CvpA family protein [Streptococcaceae bacterium]|jgi:uncharacterized membrane protein required for colicin V production|nr:CvpA family protein [Streptococcaceae bacterium]